ncbi:hypothetical protein C8A00DRAFT_41698 [Chaetomidium leptoderma]|uniref:Nephrocystin 3-like N-terminal domain-containing protein n=1 Tax=Chaetomidium leptoderma TaxID=669021 RepID=A0AAN6VQG8_9PEZI|nr:hypothetical protein C8A00DRAFT_41698 [Chaetomidium leptoderma]
MTFGYNSTRYFSRSEADVRDFASGLLVALKSKRRGRGERKRPIIFLCHSLGGLVFKQAVILAHEQNDHYSVILDNIHGVAFFGTPHRGSDLAFWDRIGTSLSHIGTLGYLGNSKMSKSLKVNAKMLKDITDSFAHRGGKFGIRTFYETERMTGLNGRVVEQQSATLGWPNELAIAAAANHTNLVKFPSSSNQRYQDAVFAISELVGDPLEDDDAPFSLSEERCMRDLNSDYGNHLDQVDDPVPGTCEWVISHETWSQWHMSRKSALLWITADAGCGKSVTAKFLVNHLLSLPNFCQTKNICYFFFKEGLEDQDNASAAVSAVLHQMCASQRRLIKHVMAKFTSMPKRAFNRCSSLWSVLMTVLEDPKMQDMAWILDGLDECEPKSLDELLEGLVAYIDSNSTSDPRMPITRLKVILLSRPHNKIQQTLRLGGEEEEDEANGHGKERTGKPSDNRNRFRLIAEEQTKAMGKDIARFVRFKISEFGETSELLAGMLASLEERLISGADYTFLWISLVIKLVEDARVDGISMTQLESILNTTHLDDVYERLLSGKPLPLKGRKALMLVLAAVRPLSVREMCPAIEVHQDHVPRAEGDAATRARLADYALDLRLGERARVQAGRPGESNQAMYSELRRKMEAAASQPKSVPGETNSIPAKAKDSNAASASVTSPSTVRGLNELGKLLHKPFANHLRQICGHFLRIRGGKVYLVHQTAREFLLTRSGFIDLDAFDVWVAPSLNDPPLESQGRRQGRGDHGEDRRTTAARPTTHKQLTPRQPHQPKRHWRHSIRLKDANRLLLRTCADYLGLFQFDDAHTQNTTRWTGKTVTEHLMKIRNDPPRAFFKYAAFHWIDHYRPVRQELEFSYDHLLNPGSALFKIWSIVHRSWVPDEERSALEAGGVHIGRIKGEDAEKVWRTGNEFYLSLQTADLKGMERVGWLDDRAWLEDWELVDKKKVAEQFEAVLDHFNFSYGKEMELYDKEFLAGDKWWKKHKERDQSGEDLEDEVNEDGEENGGSGFDVGQIPDRVQFYRRQRRAVVMERLGEMSNPLSPMKGNPTALDFGMFSL